MSLKPKEMNFKECWPRIGLTIHKLISFHHVGKDEWRDRFEDVYDLCISIPNPYDAQLYFSTEEYLLTFVKKVYKMAVSSNKKWLVCYHETWKRYSQGTNYLSYLYWYLDRAILAADSTSSLHRHATARGTSVMRIGMLGLVMWRKHMIEPLNSKILHLLLEGIRLDRLGVIPNQSVFRGVIESFVQVGKHEKDNLEFYRENFENPFLEATGEYYRLEARRLMQENNCSQYMEKVIQKLQEEEYRSRQYLHTSSYTKVTRECEQRMATDHLEFLLGDSQKMIEEENEKDLRHLYRLLKSVPSATKNLLQQLEQYITKTGIAGITALGDVGITQAFVESFIALRDKFATFIESVFSGDHRFVAALDKAGRSIINHNWNPKFKCQAPELLAKYCDCLLKKTAKQVSEEEVENKLNNAIKIFKLINDKDVFQEFYTRCMAKRLIFKQSVSMDTEEIMIRKLKETVGFDFTRKLHLMFKDVNISADLNSLFKEYKDSRNTELGLSFSTYVLQAGTWPLVQSALSTFSFPQELEKSVRMFESFYKTKFNGRNLTWLHHMCNAELKLCYLKKPYIVSMSTYQMAILLLFETTDVLTYGEISENTKLSSEQLPKQIKSLLESKLILATHGEESFKAESSFSLNKEYTNKRTKFKLAPAAQKETAKKEEEKTHASVVSDRKMFLNAAIVRTMKERKVLKHNILIQEVINQAKDRFVPVVPMIKKCIEGLIDKQYIERTPDSTDEYNYVA